jgi:hypothetical protein
LARLACWNSSIFFKTVTYEFNRKYCSAIVAIGKSDKYSDNFPGYFLLVGPSPGLKLVSKNLRLMVDHKAGFGLVDERVGGLMVGWV